MNPEISTYLRTRTFDSIIYVFLKISHDYEYYCVPCCRPYRVVNDTRLIHGFGEKDNQFECTHKKLLGNCLDGSAKTLFYNLVFVNVVYNQVSSVCWYYIDFLYSSVSRHQCLCLSLSSFFASVVLTLKCLCLLSHHVHMPMRNVKKSSQQQVHLFWETGQSSSCLSWLDRKKHTKGDMPWALVVLVIVHTRLVYQNDQILVVN